METKISSMQVLSFRAICTWCIYLAKILEMIKYCSYSNWRQNYLRLNRLYRFINYLIYAE